jgi:hypothetical protein
MAAMPPIREMRALFGGRAETKGKLPDFVRRCSDLGQFWGFIKYEKSSYAGRRMLIWDAFRPLIEYLEAQDRAPGVAPITATLEAFDPDHVHAAWQKALDRRASDPEGAITAARALIETVCKHTLDDMREPYSSRPLCRCLGFPCWLPTSMGAGTTPYRY